MKHLTVISTQSIRKKLNAKERNHCFEIFGYDFIIDEEFKVWLIEINTNPCLEESSKLLKMLLPRMISNLHLIIDDALKLSVDLVFQKKKSQNENIQAYKVDGYNDLENMWEFVCKLGFTKSDHE